MKIGGKTISEPDVVIIPIVRSTGDVIFQCKAVLSYDDFNKLCPVPHPPTRTYVDGRKMEDTEDAGYKAKVNDWADKHTHYMVLQSLSATPDLVWDTVDMSRPETWGNYLAEFTASGLVETETKRIIQGVIQANSMSNDMIDEARKRFLASQLPVA
jgi:hypothetical protein